MNMNLLIYFEGGEIKTCSLLKVASPWKEIVTYLMRTRNYLLCIKHLDRALTSRFEVKNERRYTSIHL